MIDLERFLEDLHKKYLPDGQDANRRSRAETAWSHEEPLLRQILPNLDESLGDRYALSRVLGVGGVGIVLQVRDTNLDSFRALKFPRPSAGREALFAEVIASEISHLREATHQNIIGIFYHDTIKSNPFPVPYYIMEQIHGANDAVEYFDHISAPSAGAGPFRAKMLNVLSQVLEGLVHLHSIEMLHGDMKLENILVGEGGRAVIADLGSARRLSADAQQTQVIFTRDYAHPKLIELAAHRTTSTDPNRVRAPIPRSDLRLIFDLYALGKNLLRLLNSIDSEDHMRLDHYTRKYLRLMACRMLDGQNSDSECAIGLPREVFSEIRYRYAWEVQVDIKKITGQYSVPLSIPEMDSYSVKSIQTASPTPTPLTPRLAELISHPLLGRLAGISQLGFASFVYVTARHSRFEHALGTFTNTIKYCESLYNDELNPLFRQIMTENDIICVLLAALLHDLGQYPLAHDMEDTGQGIFRHDTISVRLLRGEYDIPEAQSLRQLIRSEWHVEPERIADIISADPRRAENPVRDRLLHTIISGPIDADKLDYLMRDGMVLNLPFPRGIDFERLLQCLTVVHRRQGRGLYVALGIHEKGKFPAETVAFARYTMFGTAYWHHTSRACKAMLHRAVWESLPPEHHRTNFARYRDDLIAFILGEGRRQGTLFDKIPPAELPAHPQLSPADRAMAEWIAARTSAPAKKVLEMLVTRDLFRRIMVFSSRSARTWEKLIKFRKSAAIPDLVKMQTTLQRRAVESIREHEQADMRNPSSSAVSQTVIEELVAAHAQGEILLLVDIPVDRSGSEIRLEYLPEVSRRDTVEDWSQPVALEDSVIWRTLHENFLESVGKIRIFCHPRFRETFNAGMQRTEYENLIDESLEEVLSLPSSN